MKIGLVHNSLNIRGGAERFLTHLLTVLKHRGHETCLATFDKTHWRDLSYFFGPVTRPDEEVCTLPVQLRLFSIYQNVVASLFLQKLNHCDAVMDTHGGVYLSSPLFRRGIDVTYCHGGLTYHTLSEKATDKYSHGLWRLYYQPQLLLARLFEAPRGLLLTNSVFSARQLKDRLQLDSKVVYPPVDTSLASLAGTEERENAVLTMARFTQEKNLRLIGRLSEKLPDVTFHIAGMTSVGSASVLNELQKPNITLHVDPCWTEVRQLQARCKLYLSTMTWEHFGLSIAESMSAGCIPVCYGGGGVPEFVPKKYLFKTLDEAVEKIQAALLSWTVDHALEVSEAVQWLNLERFGDEICPILEGVTK